MIYLIYRDTISFVSNNRFGIFLNNITFEVKKQSMKSIMSVYVNTSKEKKIIERQKLYKNFIIFFLLLLLLLIISANQFLLSKQIDGKFASAELSSSQKNTVKNAETDENENEDTNADESDKDKIKQILLDVDKDILIRIVEALDIEYDENEDSASLIDKILGRIEIIPKTQSDMDTEGESDEDESGVVEDDGEDRTDIDSPLSDNSWNLDYDILSTKRFEVNGVKYTQMIAFGDCKVEYSGTVLTSEVIILNRPEAGGASFLPGSDENENNEEAESSDNLRIEVMIFGDVKIESSGNVFFTERAFFYPDTMRTVLYDVTAYFPQSGGVGGSKPFMVNADTIKLLSGTDEVIVDGVELSTSYLEFPHYKFLGTTLWYYPNGDGEFFLSNMAFQVGQSILFYFPFLFQTDFGTGINLDFRYNRGLGFYLKSDIPFDIFGYRNTLILDYYQKMGIYFTLAEDIKLPFFTLKLNGAYDRAVRFLGRSERDPEIFSNYVDINNDGTYEETFNSFRYNLSLQSDSLTFYEGEELDLEKLLEDNGSLDILDSLDDSQVNGLKSIIQKLINNFQAGGNFSFKKVSDPLFRSQFINFGADRTKFDFLTTIQKYTDYSAESQAPSVPGSNSEAMSVNASMSASISELVSISISGDWSWTFRSKAGELNPYDVLNYYDVQLSRAVFPSFSLNFKQLKISDNIIEDLTGLIVGLVDPEFDFETMSDLVDGLSVSLPLSMNIRFSHSPVQQFITEGTEIKENDSFVKDDLGELSKDQSTEMTTFGYNLPFRISFKDFVSYNLSMSYNLKYKYRSTRVDTDKTQEEILRTDLDNTKFRWSWSLSSSITFSFFDEYEFLDLDLSFGLNFSRSGIFDDLIFQLGLSDTEIGESYTESASGNNDVIKMNPISISFFKSTLSFSGLSFPIRLTDEDKKKLGNIDTLSISQDAFYHEYYGIDSVDVLIDKDYLFNQKRRDFSLSFSTSLIPNLGLGVSYNEKNKWDIQDYYHLADGGRDYVIEEYGYPSLFGGKGEKIALNLNYDFFFGLYAGGSFSHFFGREEHRKDHLHIDVDYEIDMAYLLFNEILIKSFSIKTNYDHYFGEQERKDDKIDITIGMDFDITTLWTLSVSYRVDNKHLWRYTDHPDLPGSQRRGFFEDIWLALQFWNYESLQSTFWKVRSLNFSLTHDLAEWLMTFGVNIGPNVNPIGGELPFEVNLDFSIILLDVDFSGGLNGDGYIPTDSFIYDRF